MTTEAEIEALVSTRQVSQANRAILSYIKSRQPSKIFVACEFYRRLGQFHNGLRLLKTNFTLETLGKATSRTSDENMALAWYARLLNSLGASELAQLVIRRLESEEFFVQKVAGQVFLTNFSFDLAIQAFKKVIPYQKRSSRAWIMTNLCIADCLSGMGDSQSAISLIDELLSYDETQRVSSLRAVLLSAKTEYFAKLKEFRQAWFVGSQAMELFLKGDTTIDKTVHNKWMGFVAAHLGRGDQALQHFQDASVGFDLNRCRAEGWFDLLLLQKQVDMATSEMMTTVNTYPCLSLLLVNKLNRDFEVIGNPGVARFTINLQKNEYQCDGNKVLGTPLVLQLLAFLRCAGQKGISAVRLISTFWPDEPYAYEFLEERLEKLEQRLRRHFGVNVMRNRGSVFLCPSEFQNVAVICNDSSTPSIVESKKQFNRLQFQEFYGLKKTQANSYLQTFLDRRLIERLGSGRNSYYRCFNSA